MKKLFTLALILAVNCSIYSQISFNQEDVNRLYKMGTSVMNVSGNINVKMDIGTASNTSQNWTFPNAIFPDTTVINIITPQGTPADTAFPNATLCLTTPIMEIYQLYSYLQIGQNFMASVGMAMCTGDKVSSIQKNIDTMSLLPINYGYNVSNTNRNDIGPNEYRIRTMTTTYDAWGKITFSFGTFDCLRFSQVEVEETYSFGTLTNTNIKRGVGFISDASRIYFRINTLPTGIVDIESAEMELYSTVTNLEDESSVQNKSFELLQNYPNPFNPQTAISYSIPEDGNVELKIFDMIGNEVANLVNGYQTAGTHRVDFNGSNLSSGVYFYTLKSNGFTKTNKMMLIK